MLVSRRSLVIELKTNYARPSSPYHFRFQVAFTRKVGRSGPPQAVFEKNQVFIRDIVLYSPITVSNLTPENLGRLTLGDKFTLTVEHRPRPTAYCSKGFRTVFTSVSRLAHGAKQEVNVKPRLSVMDGSSIRISLRQVTP